MQFRHQRHPHRPIRGVGAAKKFAALGRGGRAAAARRGPLLRNFQLHQPPSVAGGGGGGGGTVFLAILHRIMVFPCFSMFFDVFWWF